MDIQYSIDVADKADHVERLLVDRWSRMEWQGLSRIRKVSES